MPSDISMAGIPLLPWLFLGVLLLVLAGCAMPRPAPPAYKNWAVYYGANAPAESFKGYDLLVFDADQHPDIATVKAQGSEVLAYISLAEIAEYRAYATRFIDQSNISIGYNDTWKSHVIDVRAPQWQEFVVKEWLPSILAKGFDGVFLDTIDTALYWQQKDEKNQHMDRAIIDTIIKMRSAMPAKKRIMVNRGFDILPDIARDIDIVLAESILVDAEAKENTYFSDEIYQHYVDILQELKQKHSHLAIFALDYPRTIDKTAWLHICRRHQAHGFTPYISTMDLQQIQAPFPACDKGYN